MKEITRSALYELVWAKPRSVLAKQFNISDVALAKRCLKANIPMPPRGYWAKIEAGKSRAARPPLPLRLPGSREVISFDQDRYGSRNGSLSEQELQPPSFSESVAELVEAAMQRLGSVRALRDLSAPHPGLATVLRAEAARRQQYEAHKWDHYRPHFAGPEHQRQMRLANALLHAFDRLGCRGWMSDRNEWVQGRGTLHHIVGSVGFGGTSVSFAFPERDHGRLVLTVEKGSREDAAIEWQDERRRPLERQLNAIARGLLETAERRLRANAQWQHRWALERQAAHEQEEQRKRESAQRMRAEEEQRRRQLARDRLLAMAADHRAANDIRSLVAALKEKPELQTNGLDSPFARWCKFALAQAQQLDPVVAASLEFFELDLTSVFQA
jgi:hypothetical protein